MSRGPAFQCCRRATAPKARAVAVLPGVSLQGDSKVKIVERVSEQPGSTAGDVAKALDLERTVTGTRLVQMAASGSLVVCAASKIVRLPTAGR